VERGCAGPETLRVVGDLRHRAHRRPARPDRRLTVDGDGGRNRIEAVDRRSGETLEKLTRVGAERLDVAPLPLGVEGPERERALPRAGRPGEHHERARFQIEIDRT
jgi:hypothetical protein